MPTPSQRYSRPNSPPGDATESATTPLRPRLSTLFNTPNSGTSYSPTVTPAGQAQKLNVVTRVAIEGKANQGEDGVGIKMYLKISLPLDNITPGTSIPLFSEENVKILDSQVHPLDKDSTPYDFSSELSPLLHHAARALSLNRPLQENYHTAYGLSPPPGNASVVSSFRAPKTNGTSSRKTPAHPVDVKYTGQILVSGYNIAYVLPKTFPTRLLDSEHHSRSSSIRRSSMTDRTANFMAAIDLWVPYAAKPPRSPYLLSIPTPPRCLSNTIRLRIFPPPSQSSSTASLSSDGEDTGGGGSWDLTSDPPVTRKQSRYTRPGNPYGHTADSESSDSSIAESTGGGIRGAFPTTERIRVRWGKPQIAVGPEDGRRRVGVSDVKGEMTIAVLGKKWNAELQREGIVMEVDYKSACKNVWFPGVATMLGMDVSLEAKGSDLSWLSEQDAGWEVGGSTGYTGFDVGGPSTPHGPSRHDSLESNYSNGPQIFLSAERPISRQSSASSSASLLRAPLPVNNVPEYSFEGAPSSQSTSLESSMAASSMPSDSGVLLRPPGVPVTIHIDMNKIMPSSAAGKNAFSFSIKGTVLVTSRPRNPPAGEEADAIDPESVVLPRFTVLAANAESVTTIVRNNLDAGSSTVEVTNPNSRSKTVLQRNDYLKCREYARVLVRSGVVFESTSAAGTPVLNGSANARLPTSRPRTPTYGSRERVLSTTGTRAMAVLGMSPTPARPKRDGALMIPSVRADVTPLSGLMDSDSATMSIPTSYAVRVSLAAPVDADSDWLEFGLAKQGGASGSTKVSGPPKVDIVGVSVDDVPVMYETRAAAVKEENRDPEAGAGLGLPFEQVGTEWVSWVKMRVGAVGGGRVVVDYVVKDIDGARTLDKKRKGKMKAKDRTHFEVYLPSFSLPVARLEVHIDGVPGLAISNLRCNFAHQQELSSGRKLLHYSLSEFFYPHISLDLSLDQRRSSLLSFGYMLLASTAVLIFAMVCIARMNSQTQPLYLSPHATAGGYSTLDSPDLDERMTTTTTVYHTSSRWPWQHFQAVPGTDSDAAEPESEPESESIIIYPSVSDTPSSQPSVALTSPPAQSSPIVISISRPGPTSSLALVPSIKFIWQWPPKLGLDTEFLRAKAKVGADYAWRFLQYVLHFPLGVPDT
ncbi:hypothetical protein C8F01DRAFT_1099335 [Mycena amicta]|nr:hypothetical protein C8F01DRAFT_1099335 [Mycena amicta]